MAPRYLLIFLLLILLGYGVEEMLRRQSGQVVPEKTVRTGGAAANKPASVAVLSHSAAPDPGAEVVRDGDSRQWGQGTSRLHPDDISRSPSVYTRHDPPPVSIGTGADADTVYDMVFDRLASSPQSIGEYVSADDTTGQVEDRYPGMPQEVGGLVDADAPFPLPDATSSGAQESLGDFVEADP